MFGIFVAASDNRGVAAHSPAVMLCNPRVRLSAIFLGSLALIACSDDVMVGGDGSGTAGSAGSGAAQSGGSSAGGAGASGGSSSSGGSVSSGGSSSGGSSASGGAGGSGASAGSGAVSGSGGTPPCVVATCQGKTFNCGDCQDNDGDGLVDQQDPDCLGACDNTEDSYYGGIPGQNQAPCKQDCYFDNDTGPGNDKCYWSHQCDPRSVGPDFPPSGLAQCVYNEAATTPGTGDSCEQLRQDQQQTCKDVCRPLTPNGCDCFGCCELPAGSQKYVWLGSEVEMAGSCDLAVVDDPALCKPCTQVPSCLNTCERCELCLGKDTVPDDCNPGSGGSGGGGTGGSGAGGSGAGGSGGGGTGGNGGGGQQCDPGVDPCGLDGQAPCDRGYCITGCCVPLPT